MAIQMNNHHNGASTDTTQTYYRTLTIAGSDSGGGAGIQADLKTFSALGCYGMSAITALTAQNTVGVQDIHPVPPEFIGRQIDSIMDDIGVDAVKIGMLHSAEVIKTVAQKLEEHKLQRVVLDPVMVAQSGDTLIEDDAIEALLEYLIPNVTLITPNVPEAARLLGKSPDADIEIEPAAKQLLDLNCDAVLIKGGHSQADDEQSRDCLAFKNKKQRDTEIEWYSSHRVRTGNTHGTGCTLSSAIAAYMARGFDLARSVQHAKKYITGAIEAGSQFKLGEGGGPLHHFYNLWYHRQGGGRPELDEVT